MKFGRIAVYQGREYEFNLKPNNTVDLYEIHDKSLYQNVTPNTIEAAYYAETYGIYQGHQFQIIDKKINKYLLLGKNWASLDLESMGFVNNENGEMIMWIDETELDRKREFRVPIKGFKLPENI